MLKIHILDIVSREDKDDRTEMGELARIAGMREGKRLLEAFQPFAKHNEWCLRFDVAEIGISIHRGEYDPSKRIIEEVRRQLALFSHNDRKVALGKVAFPTRDSTLVIEASARINHE